MKEDKSPNRKIVFEVDPLNPVDLIIEKLLDTYTSFIANDCNMPPLAWELIKISGRLQTVFITTMNMYLERAGEIKSDK